MSLFPLCSKQQQQPIAFGKSSIDNVGHAEWVFEDKPPRCCASSWIAPRVISGLLMCRIEGKFAIGKGQLDSRRLVVGSLISHLGAFECELNECHRWMEEDSANAREPRVKL